WHFMNPGIVALLRKALENELAGADGLVLDVRGRGGRSDVMFSALSVFSGKDAGWKKPVVVLQDHGTRSAKEIFAWAWKERGLGKIVGERSAGAVIGCTFKKLFDGSILMHPVMDVKRMTRGENLEGKGVEPDVPVDQGSLEFRNGKDPILDRGLDVLIERMKERASRRFL
ncbi:hypothetical protein HY251_13165, partial [bacterium]|nr:hypothetical protein [bacterium]